MTTTILDTRSKAFLQVQEVPLNDTSVKTARADYLTQLDTALKYGLPLDDEAIRFLIDYHNDSTDNIEAFSRFLYAPQADGAPSRMANYINALKKPATSGLALLLCSDAFVTNPTERNALLASSLGYASSANLPPPAQAIATLGRTNGTQATGFAETYITHAANNHIAIADDLLDALVALNGAEAARFINAELREHWDDWDCKDLMEAFYKLNPTGSTFTGSDAVPPGNIDDAFIVTPPPIEGWAAFATTMLNNATNNGKPLDAKMLTDLQKVHPVAAAYVAWYKLTRQLQQRQNLDAQCLDVLHGYNADMTKALCVAALEDAYANRAYLLSDTGGSSRDGITSALKPMHRLELESLVDEYGKPVTAQVGDIVSLTSNGGARTSRALTFADISNGFIDLEDSINGNPAGDGTTAMQFKVSGADGVVKATSTPYYVTLDRAAPVVRPGSVVAGVFTGHVEYPGKQVLQVTFNLDDLSGFTGVNTLNGLLTNNFQAQFTDYTNGPLQIAPGGIRINAPAGRVEVLFIVPPILYYSDGRSVDSVAAGLAGEDVQFRAYGLADRAGNQTGWVVHDLKASAQSVAMVPSVPAAAYTYETFARPLDHAALNKLAQIDPTLARIYKTQFAMQNLIGPAPPPVVTDDDDNDDGDGMDGIDLNNDGKPDYDLDGDIEDLDLLTAIYMAQVRRAQVLDDLLKQQMGVTQSKTDMIGKLHTLLGALNDLAGKVSSTTEGNKKIKEIITDANALAPYGDAIHAAMFAIPGGMKVFSETLGASFGDGQGHFNPDHVTKEGLKGAIDKVRGTLDALANEQQLDMLRVQSLVTKRNEAFTLLTNFIDKYGRVMETILGNLK